MKQNLMEIFSQLDDPRRDITKLHKLTDVLFIGIVGVICGCETWNDIERYARVKEAFLRRFLELPNGIPSHDTINRVFSSLDPLQFENCFIQWVSSLGSIIKGQVIAVDGKTIRGAKSEGKKSPFHLVSAWAEDNNVVLGQVRTEEKSNEITAIPQLLELVLIEDCTVTIDAMGCQQNIASKIIERGGDYILAVKQNQQQLYEDIEHVFKFPAQLRSETKTELDHGRIETRICTITTDLDEIEKVEKWKDLKTLIKIDSLREFKNSNKLPERATRYYISNLNKDPSYFQQAIRSHWSIENKLHWTLDVAFGEDASRKRIGSSAQNFSILNKIALNLLKNEKSIKIGVKGRRLIAGWDNEFLLKVLNL